MITEDFVSFEIANLLKGKGFDVECVGRYSIRSKEFHLDYTRKCNNGGLFECAAPTLQMAMKWLREQKHIYIDVFLDDDSEMPWTYNIHTETRDGGSECICHHHGNYYPLTDGYEECVEAAIKYCLENLI